MTPAAISASLRDLADRTRSAFPDMAAHQHVRDAAAAMDGGRPDGAQRHLNAAIASFTPLNMTRMGVHDDLSRVAGKKMMAETYRHLLLVKDHADAAAAQ